MSNRATLKPLENEDLAAYVRRLLEQRAMSHRELVRRSNNGISRGYVSHIVTGKAQSITTNMANALAVGLDVPVSYILQAATQTPNVQAA